MNDIRIQQLKSAIAPVRDRLVVHPVYQAVKTPAALRRFMEYHVYAVWDFMSLLKALQRSLTCVQVPWVPVGSGDARYLINEIVLGEESDVDECGRRTSHFELYLRAMKRAGASTEGIERMVRGVAGGRAVGEVIAAEAPGVAVKKFLRFTFDTIASGEMFRVAAVFTFGREDLIPDLFLPLVKEMPAEFAVFRYYLERHIEVDGGHHSDLAMAMLAGLCGEDEWKWEAAAEAAKDALEARLVLWDGVLGEVGGMA